MLTILPRLLEIVRSIVDADSKAVRQSCIDGLLEHHLGLIRGTFKSQQAAKHAVAMVEEQVSKLGCFIDALEVARLGKETLMFLNADNWRSISTLNRCGNQSWRATGLHNCGRIARVPSKCCWLYGLMGK